MLPEIAPHRIPTTFRTAPVHRTGGSLRDVQLLAGHRSLLTTQRYIDGDTDSQRQLVALIGCSLPENHRQARWRKNPWLCGATVTPMPTELFTPCVAWQAPHPLSMTRTIIWSTKACSVLSKPTIARCCSTGWYVRSAFRASPTPSPPTTWTSTAL